MRSSEILSARPGAGQRRARRSPWAWGLVALLALPAGCSDPSSGPPPPARRNILLISVDTLRADRLGAYGYARPTSPWLDGLASSGTRFADVMTPATTTQLAHGAILRGTLASAAASRPRPTLAAVLRAAGYRTAAFVDGGFMRARFGHGEGFDMYVDDLAEPAPPGARPVADRKGGGLRVILPRARAWLEEHGRDGPPWLLFLHAYDVHCPYEPPAADLAALTGVRPPAFDAAGLCGRSDLRDMDLSADDLAWLSTLYDAGIRAADRRLGEFLEWARREGLLDGTLISVFSDHGESLGEAGWFGHGRLAPEQIQVPWILAGPDLPAGKVVAGPAHLVDMMPTLLDYAGLAPPPGLAGRSLRPVIEGRETLPPDRLRVVETRRARGLATGPWLVVQTLRDGGLAAVRRRDGVEGTASAAAAAGERALAAWRDLAGMLEVREGELGVPGPPPEGRVREELRTLGYVD